MQISGGRFRQSTEHLFIERLTVNLSLFHFNLIPYYVICIRNVRVTGREQKGDSSWYLAIRSS